MGQSAQFETDGFVVLPDLIDPGLVARAGDRFAPLFAGEFATGIMPDEWNWRAGRDPDTLTRQICNGWRADPAIADIVLSELVGATVARIAGWRGSRLLQDNVIWKPPGAGPLALHQDNAYIDWVVPQQMVSCWIALDETSIEGGTVEYVRGSHLWGPGPMPDQFHNPADYQSAMRTAAGDAPVELVPIAVSPGSAVVHHGWLWHGSGPNLGTRPRRSVVAHCVPDAAEFHPTNRGGIHPIYGRYRRPGSTEMDEAFFPVLYSRDRARSSFLGASTQIEKV
ncbi:MAG: phytanoyl-CoA dioxygenase family protein [Alphaproteobacteria bacterium]